MLPLTLETFRQLTLDGCYRRGDENAGTRVSTVDLGSVRSPGRTA